MYSYKEVEELAKKYLSGNPLLGYQDLALSSYDLMDMGYKEREIAKAQEKLAMAVLQGVPNEAGALVDYLDKNE